MKNIFTNIIHILKNPKYTIAFILLMLLFGFLWYHFTDLEALLGNYGKTRFIIDTIFSFLNIIGFSLFLVAWFYRSYTLGQYSGKQENLGFLGGILAILISGTICCGSSLLLVVGSSGIIQIFSKYLPYGGMEVKILGVIILYFSLFSLLRNLLACQYIGKKKKSSK